MRSEKERALDAYLAAAARSGDRQAMDSLAERWAPKLHAHAYRLCGEGELAADISQDAWWEILRGLSSLHDDRAFAAWAFRIVTHRHARSIRSLVRRRVGEQAAAMEADVDTPAAQEQETELAMIQRAMRALPGPQRAALGLFYREGLRIAEIAVALDVPPGTVKTRLMHARRKLRALLEGELHEQD
jgi:RNA polymerase sigma-70 factor (ECF subfamily)